MRRSLPFINTFLFDLDGTFFDTASDLAFALNLLLEKYHRAPQPFSKIRPIASTGAKGLIKLGFAITDADAELPRLREEFLQIYDQYLTFSTQLFAGMEAVLEYIEKTGLRWGIVTNKPSYFARKLLKHFQLDSRCACLIGGDMVPRSKPAPDSLLMACQLLNIMPETSVYIGDAESDIKAAKQANMHSIAALYGYIAEQEEPKNWQADAYIHHPQEILSWLAN